MLRSAALARRRAAADLLCPHQQRRASYFQSEKPQRPWKPKAFVKKVDRKGNPYYIPGHRLVAREGDDPRLFRPKQEWTSKHIFQLSSLIVDLDAQNSRYVRPFDDEDEVWMREKWGKEPKRVVVRAQIQYMKDQIALAEQVMEKMKSTRHHPGRIRHRDILSAALRGAPPEEAEGQEKDLNLAHGHAHLRTLLEDNVIPDYVVKNETLFLRWMSIRREQGTYSGEVTQEEAFDSLIDTIDVMEDLSSLRRVLFDAIDDISLYLISWQGDSTPKAQLLSERVSSAISTILEGRGHDAAASFEALVILQNLVHRLALLNIDVSGQLHEPIAWLWQKADVKDPDPWPENIPDEPLEDFPTRNLSHWAKKSLRGVSLIKDYKLHSLRRKVIDAEMQAFGTPLRDDPSETGYPLTEWSQGQSAKFSGVHAESVRNDKVDVRRHHGRRITLLPWDQIPEVEISTIFRVVNSASQDSPWNPRGTFPVTESDLPEHELIKDRPLNGDWSIDYPLKFVTTSVPDMEIPEEAPGQDDEHLQLNNAFGQAGAQGNFTEEFSEQHLWDSLPNEAPLQPGGSDDFSEAAFQGEIFPEEYVFDEFSDGSFSTESFSRDLSFPGRNFPAANFDPRPPYSSKESREGDR